MSQESLVFLYVVGSLLAVSAVLHVAIQLRAVYRDIQIEVARLEIAELHRLLPDATARESADLARVERRLEAERVQWAAENRDVVRGALTDMREDHEELVASARDYPVMIEIAGRTFTVCNAVELAELELKLERALAESAS